MEPNGAEAPAAVDARLQVTVHDPVAGTTEVVRVPAGDYLLIAAEPCHVAGTQAYPTKGTHVITIKGYGGRR